MHYGTENVKCIISTINDDHTKMFAYLNMEGTGKTNYFGVII